MFLLFSWEPCSIHIHIGIGLESMKRHTSILTQLLSIKIVCISTTSPRKKKPKIVCLFFREIAHYFIKACFLLIFECFANARTTWKTSGTTLALDISKSPLGHRTKASCSWVKTMTTRTEFLGGKVEIIIIRSEMIFHLDMHLL